MTQIIRPSLDISAGGWTASGGGSLYAAVDESVASDADFIASSSAPVADSCEIKFGALGSPPGSTSGHILRYRVVGGGTGTLVVTLRCGSTTIATWTDDWSTGDRERTLSNVEAGAILDYSNLTIKFEATSGSTLPPPTYTPPTWGLIPNISFAQGVASTYSLSGYFTEGSLPPSTLSVLGTLPTGVTYDATNNRLVYNGVAAVGSSSVQMQAEDSYGAATDLTTLVIREPDGTAGMAFKEGDVPTATYVGSDLAGFQANVKNRWPDGSVKIAAVSWTGATASQASPATIKIRRVSDAPTGADVALLTLRGLGLTGSVALGSYGTVNLATVIATLPFRQWLAGPKCSEWHWRSAVGSDPTLVVWFYVRLYSNGQVWVRVIVENGYMYTTPQSGKTYRAVVTLAGVTRYDSASDSNLSFPQWYKNVNNGSNMQMWYWPWSAGNDIPHSSRTRWTMEFWYDGARSIRSPGHDGSYLIGTKLFPNYSPAGVSGFAPDQIVYDGPTPSPGAWYDEAEGASKTSPVIVNAPLGIGNWRPDTNPGGYSPTIGITPLWNVLYLTATQGSANQDKMFKCSVANGSVSGSYGFMRHETTNLPLKWSDKPNAWSGSGDSNSIATQTNQGTYSIEKEHSPSLAYATYIFTGDHFYVEAMQHEATANFIGTSYVVNNRDGIKGLMFKYETTRSWAWSMRTLAQALCITPDDYRRSVTTVNDTVVDLTTDYRNSLDYNFTDLIAIAINGTYYDAGWNANKNTLGCLVYGPAVAGSLGYAGSVFANGHRGDAPWMQNFCGMTLAHIDDMKVMSGYISSGVTAGSQAARVRQLMNFSLAHPVGLLGTNSGWPFTFAGCYAIPYVGNTFTYVTSWSDAWTKFLDAKPGMTNAKASGGPNSGDALVSWVVGDNTIDHIWNGYSYEPDMGKSTWPILQPAISAAVDKGISGASTAYARMKSAANWATHIGYTKNMPQWSVVPR